ncbi:hypothetical protein B0J18DRAFT_467077 [Chaetomium sp. MPI-SDFR-AT-0129]|uniref:Uncharacterized protein n=1 Tax=Dichotomopilus funicola TaxID=1934379 RepID=A0AAN6V085_9PEZI|nr:hypothetical protein B0J18DRAFT_467077 [Chaetomium sp. MPI-SDFR-AT-0129]KAK4142016.1 hypothetical protein C8A04DRAFT_30419 [Dichotomopilus funicola]
MDAGNTLKLSGEGKPSDNMSYSLERYLNTPGDVTERLLRGQRDVGDVKARLRTAMGKMNRLADEVSPTLQDSSSSS